MKFEILVDVGLTRQQEPKQFRTVVQAFSNQMQIMSTKVASDKQNVQYVVISAGLMIEEF